jgi:hypothetical protein
MKVAESKHTFINDLGDHILYGGPGNDVLERRGGALMFSANHTARSRLPRETTSSASGDNQGEVVIAHRHELGPSVASPSLYTESTIRYFA